jgi:hypothetical protein
MGGANLPVPESLDASPATARGEGDEGAPREPFVAEAGPPFTNHVEQRTVVIPGLRVLFLPVPKAGCTSILWLLAELAGMPLETFEESGLAEPSPTLTIHDMSLWGEEHRLASYEAEDRERILTEDGWFRFSVVRHPGTRLWSAWQSKLLLREPRFTTTFGEEPWFPRVPQRPADLVEDFRRFVSVLATGEVEDVHWAVQHDLTEHLPLGHVGQVECLEETLVLLRDHVGDDVWPAGPRIENRSPLPMPPGAFDEAAEAMLRRRYQADFEHFGYQVQEAGDAAADWEERVAPVLPMLRETIARHARIGQLHGLIQQRARRVHALESRLETAAARAVGYARAPVLTNLEGDAEFNVRWAWSDGEVRPGFTAVVRVKNEAQSLPFALPPLLRAVSHVVVVDNGSTDGTPEVAYRVAKEAGAADRFELRRYPFSVARCGQEHLETPETSVHSLAYFYNWAFSHVRTSYALKWDGDMVLTDVAVNALRDLAWQLEACEAVVKIPRYPLYVADERRAFLDIGLSNREPWAWPNKPGYSFVKALEWELPLWGEDVTMTTLPDWACIELKHLDADEFAHWSDSDFDATERTQRKRREWQVFHTLADGAEPPTGVVAVEAPEGRHVVDYVRSTWLPEKAKELTGLGERVLGRLVGLGA